jgi:hypothetical protein
METLLVAIVAVAGLAAQHLALRRAQTEFASLLERVRTEPRLELLPHHPKEKIDPQAVRYISDEPYHDHVWNEYRGVKDGEDGEVE